ncbi:MAG: hypothetical protein P4N24_15725 [Acidobacteriota bacterium]|nr:hypothetical protein [Acidobacteriota bacterium]
MDATTDRERIKAWVNAGKQLVMVAKFGKGAVLDFDNFEACKALGFDEQWLQGMLRVDTPSGPGHFHCYLPWSAALDAFPNGAANADAFDASGNLVGELKLNNSTVAAPGSLRFNSECPGKVEGAYIPVTDQNAELCPNAPAVAAWFRAHGKATKPKPEFTGRKEPWKFHPEFDQDEFLNHNLCSGLDGEGEGWIEDGVYHLVPDECPLCGQEARQNTTLAAAVTKFIFSGTCYGFICHHCGVNSRADFEGKMAEDHLDWEPWHGYIYRHDSDTLLFADAARAGLEVEMVGCSDHDETSAGTTTCPEQPAEQRSPVIHEEKPARLRLAEMPESAMYGWIADKARELQVPLGFAYAATLTAFAPCITTFPRQIRPTLYTALIGPVHCGKTETLKRVRASIQYPDPETVKTTVPGSDRGLINIFGGKKKDKKDEAFGLEVPKTRLLVQDELRNTFAKAMIQGSSLPSTLCTLFSEDEAGTADKTGEHIALVRLSILGALKAEDADDFAEVFGKGATSGLYDRFVFAVGSKGWQYFDWAPPAEPSFCCPSRPEIPATVFQMLVAWGAHNTDRHRLGEIAFRVAYISAAANQDKFISEACMAAALEFAEWQEAIRGRYKPGLGEGDRARATAAILNVLEAVQGKWIQWREVATKKNWYRKFGAAVISQARDSLARSGMTVEETEESENGRQRRTGACACARQKMRLRPSCHFWASCQSSCHLVVKENKGVKSVVMV